MEPESPWTSLEIAKLLVDILTPLIIVVLAFLFNRRLSRLEAAREDARRKQEAKEQKERDEIERRHTPHIEFDVDCRFFGPHHGRYGAEFTLTANNKGITKHEFKSIRLRLRGIRHDEALSCWGGPYGHRLEFPGKIVEDEVKPKTWECIFVEPGVTQRLSYITMIDAEIRYIVARAEFLYEKYTSHSTERMFEVKENPSVGTGYHEKEM